MISISRPYKTDYNAYNFYVEPEVREAWQYCEKEVAKDPQHKAVVTVLNDMMRGKPAPKGWESSNIHTRSPYWHEKISAHSKAVEECKKIRLNRSPTGVAINTLNGIADVISAVKDTPIPWIVVAGVLAIVVVVLLVTRK